MVGEISKPTKLELPYHRTFLDGTVVLVWNGVDNFEMPVDEALMDQMPKPCMLATCDVYGLWQFLDCLRNMIAEGASSIVVWASNDDVYQRCVAFLKAQNWEHLVNPTTSWRN